MAQDQPVKALIVTVADDPAAAVYTINRLKPQLLCFVLGESGKALVETAVQPRIDQMPRRWDWIVAERPMDFGSSYQAIARALPDLVRAWEVEPGELVVDLTGATPPIAAALSLAALPWTSRAVSLIQAAEDQEDVIEVAGGRFVWTQHNPWDEAAAVSRREGSALFNRGQFDAASGLFRDAEARVSGGQKPLYRALADMADGYGSWERFHYRHAWDKVKGALKALEMASVWGGPPGLKAILPGVKANAGFLERLVLDPAEIKEGLVQDLIAHAARRLHVTHDPEGAMRALLRALEACAQHRLFKSHRIKSWDVQPEQLPPPLQDVCRTCYLDDVDGKYKLPSHAQFRVLAGLGDALGQAYLKEWPMLKPLLDAAHHAVLGHGFEPIKSERVKQLYDAVLKVASINEQSLPKFPVLNL